MKRELLAIIFACFTLALSAQYDIRVNYQGAQPTISDFASAFLSSRDDVEDDDCCVDEAFNAIRTVWNHYHNGIALLDGQTLTIDEKNGYVLYESRSEYESDVVVVMMEMCYWNEADGKHKLFAYNVECFRNGVFIAGQYDGIVFYRYDNATKMMTICDGPGFGVVYDTNDDAWISFALPRTGKDITVTSWYQNGKKPRQRTLKWDGHQFGF